MKIKTLTLIVFSTFLILPTLRADGFFFGIGGGERYHRGNFYAHKAYRPSVVVVEEDSPVVVRETVVRNSGGIPYGSLHGGKLKSPWSDFTMSVGGKTSGQVIYDPNTGQPFRVP